MKDRLAAWSNAHPYARWIYPIFLVVITAAAIWSRAAGRDFLWVYLGIFALGLFMLWPGSALHAAPMQPPARLKTVFTVFVAACTIAACVLPMGLFPVWNGEIPEHRNQYELMADAILDGHIDLDYGDDEALSKLENPYDPAQRAGVPYHWDHAYYNGHYYMYFGVVPVLLLFLPYRVLTGAPLTTYHASQIFAAAAIAGIFVLFHLLSKLFFKKLPYSVYLAASVAVSVMSLWHCTAAPALYCTAIVSAVSLEIWSLYFFIRAVWYERRENRQILFAGVGAIFGALTFGCRPPVALANILVLPMLIVFLKQRKFTAKLLGKLAAAALPYVIVGVALMLYNYVRFDDPFEFGQSYQLTSADQSNYSFHLDMAMLQHILSASADNFFHVGGLRAAFPYLAPQSLFGNYPMLLLCVFTFKPAVWKEMSRTRSLALVLSIYFTTVVITVMDIIWTPYLLEEYRMDVYFLMGIAYFLTVGTWYNTCSEKSGAWLSFASTGLSAAAVIVSVLLCIYTIGTWYPDTVTSIGAMLRLT